MNICTRSKEYLKKFPEEKILPIFTNIVQNTQDIELAQLGIKYLAWELESNKEVLINLLLIIIIITIIIIIITKIKM